MISELARRMFIKYSEPFDGVRFTKHFFERLEERGLLYDFGKILQYIDKHLCELIFLAAGSGRDEISITISGIKIPMALSYGSVPTLHIVTVYKQS